MSSSPVPRRTAWLLVAGGFAGLVTSVAFGITLTTGLVFVGLLGGLAYALGVSGLAERKWIALPADNTRWNLVLVTSVPLAMILLVPVARALRQVP